MSKVIRKNRSIVEGSELVEEYVASGRTQWEYCRAIGVSIGTLQYWLRRVHGGVEADGNEFGVRPEDRHFVEVKLDAPIGLPRKADAPGYEIVLGNGRRLRVGGGFDGQEVAALLAILEDR
jgi:hypothetical protein